METASPGGEKGKLRLVHAFILNFYTHNIKAQMWKSAKT